MADSSTISNSSSKSMITTPAVSEQLSFNFRFLSIARSINVSFYFHWSSQLLLFPTVFILHRTASLFFLKLCFSFFFFCSVCVFCLKCCFLPLKHCIASIIPKLKNLRVAKASLRRSKILSRVCDPEVCHLLLSLVLWPTGCCH